MLFSKTVTTIYKGDTIVWNEREKAISFFRTALKSSTGSEHQRNSRIYKKLIMGESICSDED